MKVALIFLLVLGTSSCSWHKVIRVPDKWKPNQELHCTEDNWLAAVDVLVPPLLVVGGFGAGVAGSGGYDGSQKPNKELENVGIVALLIGLPWLVVGLPSALTGTVWTETCRKAKKKRWLLLHPDEKPEPFELETTATIECKGVEQGAQCRFKATGKPLRVCATLTMTCFDAKQGVPHETEICSDWLPDRKYATKTFVDFEPPIGPGEPCTQTYIGEHTYSFEPPPEEQKQKRSVPDTAAPTEESAPVPQPPTEPTNASDVDQEQAAEPKQDAGKETNPEAKPQPALPSGTPPNSRLRF